MGGGDWLAPFPCFRYFFIFFAWFSICLLFGVCVCVKPCLSNPDEILYRGWGVWGDACVQCVLFLSPSSPRSFDIQTLMNPITSAWLVKRKIPKTLPEVSLVHTHTHTHSLVAITFHLNYMLSSVAGPMREGGGRETYITCNTLPTSLSC